MIRPARAEEIPRILEIEEAAGRMLHGLGLLDETRDEGFPEEVLAHLVGLGQVFVACEDGRPVGMAIVSVHGDVVYLEEMDVLPECGRRGFGGRLLEHVCAWAGEKGMAVTLSTFRDLPWNAPFYRKHGFVELEAPAWTAWMREIREKEAERGLRVDARVMMRRDARGIE